MKLTPSSDTVFRPFPDRIQDQTILTLRECGVEGQMHLNSQNGLVTHSFFGDVDVCGGMGMSDRLRKIHIKSCLAWRVMYSQRHVC